MSSKLKSPTLFFAIILLSGCPVKHPKVDSLEYDIPVFGSELIHNSIYSYMLPKTFKEKDDSLNDACNASYETDGIDLKVSYAENAVDFQNWPLEATYRTIDLESEMAQVGFYNSKDKSDYKRVMQVYVKGTDRHAALSMSAFCRGDEELETVDYIFRTISFR